MIRRLFATTLALVVLGATPSIAQLPGLDLEPYIGAYIPTQDIIDQNVIGVGQVKGSQKNSLAVGARLTAWLAGPLGIEGNFVYNFSDAELTDGATTADTSAAVWMGDLRLILNMLPGPVGIHITGGVATIGYTGDAYSDVTEGKTNLGGVAGAGLKFKLPGILSIRGDADVYAYKVQLGGEVEGILLETNSQWQVDLIVSAGLIISVI
jgi:hypothetical protein